MAVGTALAVGGALAGALGSSKQAKAQKQASAAAAEAAKFRPYNVNGSWGNVAFDPYSDSVRGTLSPEMQSFRSLFGDQALRYLNGNSPTSGFQQFAGQVGSEQIPGLFNQALNTAGMIPANEYAQAQSLFGQDMSGLVNSRLDLLRQQAAPYEQRALGMIENSAFARGQLGGPGGRLALAEFGDSLSRADLGRQMAAQDLGMAARSQNIDAGNAIFGAGSTMSNLVNARAQQRLQNATGLFGFGNELQMQDYNQGQGYFGQMQGMDEQLRNWIALGGNIGGTQAHAGANQGAFMMGNAGSPGGAFLGSLGTGLFEQGINSMPLGKPAQPTGYFNPTPKLGGNFWEGPQ